MSSVDDTIGQGGDFQKGATQQGPIYDTSPTGLGLMASYLGGARADASASSSSGGVLVYDKSRTSNVSTSGTTYGTGADLLASALSFTADGASDYLVKVFAAGIANSSGAMNAALNIDGSQSTTIVDGNNIGAITSAGGIILAPAAGSHTVNIRIWSFSAGTTTARAGVGGSGVDGPIVVTVEAL